MLLLLLVCVFGCHVTSVSYYWFFKCCCCIVYFDDMNSKKGHGGQMKDSSGDEDDGFDEVLMPADYKEVGHIQDDEIFGEFVTKVAAGVTVTCMIDCCHSGTAMDLPYVCNAGDKKMKVDAGFKIPSSGMALKAPKKSSSSSKKSDGKKKTSLAAAAVKKEKKGAKPIVAEDATDDGYSAAAASQSPAPEKKKRGLFGFGKKK
jgi:Caspase domain